MSIIKEFRAAQKQRKVSLFPNDLITDFYELEREPEEDEDTLSETMAVVDGVEIDKEQILYRVHQESGYKPATDAFTEEELHSPAFRFREIYPSDSVKRTQPKFWPGDYVYVDPEYVAKRITDVCIGTYHMPHGGLSHSDDIWEYWLEDEGNSYSECELRLVDPRDIGGEAVIA